jgi:serine/threonine-protein kinase RsbW
MSEVSVRIPARANYVHVVRSLVAAVAARENLSVDDIEDLRLALGEACAYLLGISAEEPAAELSLRIDRQPGRLDVRTSVDSENRRPPKADPQQTVMWHILAALADEARLEETPTGPAIHLTKMLPEL